MPPIDVMEPVIFPPDLQERIQTYYSDFFTSYRILYPTVGQERIDALLKRVQEAYEQRPDALRQQDQLRVQHPNWFTENGLIGMMLYVDLFAGDLQGLAERLGYLEELGVTYLHLMPLLKPREGANDGGYAVADYRQVDPRLGSMKDLRQLADKLRNRGMVLVIDFVMNHTAKEHEWAQRAISGEAYYQNFYRMFSDRRQPDAYEKTLPEVFPDFAPGNFTWEEQPRKWVWTTFNEYQWDLNYENPDVFEAMLDEIFFLVNQGVDILRLDAVPFLWKKMGTNSQNQPEVIHLLAAFKALVRMAAPGVLFKSEAIVAPE
ncbi:MAG TPA: amylosucrase, partial [Bacteroidetes bacterium]|nr:amylosucrase [Bacteroidota bacterium]